MMVYAQDEVLVQKSDTILGVHPYEYNEEVAEHTAHWSLFFPVGLTFADMDEVGGAKLGSGLNNLTINGGVGVEYNFTPLWGLGGEFNVANYGKNSFLARKSDEGVRLDKDGKPASLGMLYNMSIYATFDFADAFFPRRQKTLVNVYGMFGAGLGFYTFQATDALAFSSTKDKNKRYNYDPYILFGLKLDFNVTRQFGLGIRAMYNYYMSDNLDYSGTSGSAGDKVGRINSNNDGLFTADLVFRYNIEGNPKSHMRNMPRGLWEDQHIRNMMGGMPAGGRDTVYITRDTVIREVGGNNNIMAAAYVGEPENVFYVYFDNDKIDLTEKALMTIQQVADLLHNDSTMGIQVGGFADNTGTAERNAYLCEYRAKNVMDEFIHEHGIDPSRVEARPVGVVKGGRSVGSYAPNRRVSIYLVPVEELNKDFLKMRKKDMEAQKNEMLNNLRMQMEKQLNAINKE